MVATCARVVDMHANQAVAVAAQVVLVVDKTEVIELGAMPRVMPVANR